MRKDISEDEWELIEAIRAYQKAKSQSPYYLERHVDDCVDKLMDRYS
jgi:hypothetical protein